MNAEIRYLGAQRRPERPQVVPLGRRTLADGVHRAVEHLEPRAIVDCECQEGRASAVRRAAPLPIADEHRQPEPFEILVERAPVGPVVPHRAWRPRDYEVIRCRRFPLPSPGAGFGANPTSALIAIGHGPGRCFWRPTLSAVELARESGWPHQDDFHTKARKP